MTLTRFDKDTQVQNLAGGINDNSDIIEAHFDDINPHPCGRLSLDVSGDTDVNLTEEQARNAQLVFTGTLTGDISVIMPNNNMVYHVQNQTSGDFTLTLKTGAGSGVVIQQASLPNHPRIVKVLNDGTDVVWADSEQRIGSILQYFTRPRTMLYDSGDNRWRDVDGVGFYYAGSDGVSRGYPADYVFVMHLKLSGGSVVFQLALGGSGSLWSRRVTSSTSFADAAWVAV